MWRQWWLCLLFMLQVVVTLGLIAGYIYDVSSVKPSSSQDPFQSALFEPASDGHDREQIPRSKPSVKMKAIPLSYLKDKLPEVSSSSEFIRLFMDSKADDHLLNHQMSRTKRSFPWSLGQEQQRLLQNKEMLTHESGRALDPIRISTQKSKSFQKRNASEVKKVISPLEESADADRIDDADYYIDYPRNSHVPDDHIQNNLEAFEAALHHIDETNYCSAFKCRHPTPYVHRVTDPHESTRVFLPECVVLHRCMNYTGCCGEGSECVPKSMNVVNKAFLMIDRLTDLDDHVIFNPTMATTLEFVNHTECECREKQQLPKCTKRCPQSFRLTQAGELCKCDCFPLANQEGWPCQNVKDGLVSLSGDALACIRNSSCYMPECTIGEFDTKTGFCPLTDDYAIPASFFQHPDDRRLYRYHLSSLDFSKPLTKFTHSSKDDETGSHPTESVHGYPETASGVLKTSISTTEEININSSSKKSKFTSETKLIHSAVDTQLVSTDSVSFSENNGTFSVESEDFNSSSSLTFVDKSIHKTNDAQGSDKSVFDKDNNVNLTIRDISSENITSSLNRTGLSSPVLAKENGNSANTEKTGTTSAYIIFGAQILNKAVNSKVITSTTEPVPDIIRNTVPTLSMLGYGDAFIPSSVPKNNFQSSNDVKPITDNSEELDSNLLKNILKSHLSYRLHENYPVAISSTSNAVSDNMEISKSTTKSTSTSTQPLSSITLSEVMSSVYPHLPSVSANPLLPTLKTSQKEDLSENIQYP